MGNLFSVPAFFILFRETVEAALVTSILLNYVNKSYYNVDAKRALNKQIWFGVAAGLFLSILIGCVIIGLYYSLKTQIFNERTEQIWEGVLYTVAVVFLTVFSLKMLDISSLYDKWEKKIKQAVQSHQQLDSTKLSQYHESPPSLKKKFALFILSFTVIVREGLESVVFLAGVTAGSVSPTSIPLAGVVGVLVGLIFSYLFYKGVGRLHMKQFILLSSILILFIAAGLASSAAHEFEEFHYEQLRESRDEELIRNGMSSEDAEKLVHAEIPGSTPILWNVSSCCSEKTNDGWGIAKVLFGWRSKPTVATTVTYFTYWMIVFLMLTVRFVLKRRNKNKNIEDEEQNSSPNSHLTLDAGLADDHKQGD